MTANMPTTLTVPCYTVGGPVQIWASTGTAGASGPASAMELLGWSKNGISLTEQPFVSGLKSDVSGGAEGPENDFQWLGEAHIITAELAQYNTAILAKLARRVQAFVTARKKGMLIGCSGGNFRVLLLGGPILTGAGTVAASFVRNYTNVFINDQIDLEPIGTPVLYPRIRFYGLEDPANTDSSPWNTTYTPGSGSVT